MEMSYRFEAGSVEGFVQLLAANYVSRGYSFSVTGVVPGKKEPRAVDQKLIAKYEVDISPSARMRRKKAGRASVQYLRHDRFFVLVATHGEHRFFHEERNLKTFRDQPLRYAGYAVSYRFSPVTKRWHAHVRIDRERYLDLRAYLSGCALHRSVDNLIIEFGRIPFAAFAPIRRQLFGLLRRVNKLRHLAGYDLVPVSALRLRRTSVKVYRTLDEQEGPTTVEISRRGRLGLAPESPTTF